MNDDKKHQNLVEQETEFYTREMTAHMSRDEIIKRFSQESAAFKIQEQNRLTASRVQHEKMQQLEMKAQKAEADVIDLNQQIASLKDALASAKSLNTDLKNGLTDAKAQVASLHNISKRLFQ